MDRNNKKGLDTIHNLRNANIDDLAKRYVKRKSGLTTEFSKAFETSINSKKIDGFYNYGILHLVCERSQNSLDYLYNQIFKETSDILELNGYQLRIDNVLEDFNLVLNDDIMVLLELRKEKNVDKFLPYIEKKVDMFVNDIMSKVLNRVLGNNLTDLL